MGTVTLPTTFADGTVPTAAQFNGDFAAITNEFNGNIENANVKAGAAIASSKISFGTEMWTRAVLSLGTYDISVGTGKDEFTIPATVPASKMVIETVEVETDIAPSAAHTLTADVNKNGTSILSAGISVANTAILTTGTTPSVVTVSAGDRFTFDIDVATAGLTTTRVRINIVIKQYLQTS